jgi:hypothetical protein
MSLQDQLQQTIEELEHPGTKPLNLVAMRDLLIETAKTLRASDLRRSEMDAAEQALTAERDLFRRWMRDHTLGRARALRRGQDEMDRIDGAGTFAELSALQQAVGRTFDTEFTTTPTVTDAPAADNRDLTAFRV